MKYLVYLLALCLVSSIALAGIGPSGAPIGCFSDSIIDVQTKGAKVDVQACSTDNTTGCTHGGSMDNNATATLTDTTDNPFVSADAGKLICVDKANAATNFTGAHKPSCGTVSTFTDSGHVVLSFKNASGGAITAADFYWGTDDSTAIQNALNAAATQGGGTVLIPTGCSALSTGLTWPTAPIVLAGMGARGDMERETTGSGYYNKPGSCMRWLTQGLAGPGISISGTAGHSYYIVGGTIEDLGIYGDTGQSWSGGGHDGIDILNWGDLMFRDVNISGWAASGVYTDSISILTGNNFTNKVIFENDTVKYNGTDGFTIGGISGGYVQNFALSGTESSRNGRAGVYVSGASGALFGGLQGLSINNQSLIQYNNYAQTNPGYEIQNAGTINGGAIVGNHFEANFNNTSPLLLGTHTGLLICGNFYTLKSFTGGALPSGGLAFCQTS